MPSARYVPSGHVKGIYIISQPSETRLYRICVVNISHEHKRVYREKRIIMSDKTIKELAVELTVELTMLCDGIKGRSVFVNQLLRCCSSVGANAHEAKYAQSKADFVSKLEIALKECYETEYWLELMQKAELLSLDISKGVLHDCGVIRRMLIASINTAKGNSK